MPKGLNLKTFGRRRSSGNALDDLDREQQQQEPQQQQPPPSSTTQTSSFRVLERPDKKSVTYGSRDTPVTRPFISPLHALRGKSVDDLGRSQDPSPDSSRNRPGWPLSGARGSGGTTNSGSSGYYESSSASARHSSTSTLPSSLDQDHHPDEEDFFPTKRAHAPGMYQTVAATPDGPPPAPSASFSTRAARAFSFGNRNKNPKDLKEDVPPVPPVHGDTASRERAMTTSSYASTAVPPKTELILEDFGQDESFMDIFKNINRNSQPPPPQPASASFHRTESEPIFPPRAQSRNAPSPSQKPLQSPPPFDGSQSPYLYDERRSNDGLLTSSALNSPNLTADGMAAQSFLGNAKSGYSRVPDRYTSPELKRSGSVDSYSSVTDDKEPAYPNRVAHVEESDRWVKRVELRDPQGPNTILSPASSKAGTTLSSRSGSARVVPSPTQATGYASRTEVSTPQGSLGDFSIAESTNTTPRAARTESKGKGRAESSMFDSSPRGAPSPAIRPPVHQRATSGGLKRMTKAQFQALQKHEQSSAEQSSEEEDLSGDDYDDDDDIERAKNMAKQRQKQEANMSVYRQQMKKVTGGGPTDLPSTSGASTIRPSMDRNGSSTSNASGIGLHFGGIGGTPPTDTMKPKEDENEDDDVPLGILQAHGFPNGSRPPTRQEAIDAANQRRTSVAGSVVNSGAGQGNLPVFARRLPADPYFGAGLVNQSTRESLAMNNMSSGASVVGMPPGQMPQPPPTGQPGHPGGLVGIIAGEERAKAARRGSPNPVTGQFNSMGASPLPGNMPMPQMPRTMSMGNLPTPSMYGAPPVPPMPQMPGMMGMGQMGMMPQMPQQQSMDPGQQQMQQFMQMQMQLMQNMLQMQQAQLGQPGAQTPGAQLQQQAGDYLGANFNNAQRPMSIASQHSQVQPPNPNQGRAMTMMGPPSNWNQPPQPGAPRPNSAMHLGSNSFGPSVSGLNISGGGPGAGYTPSIAPSERSNVGMPSRYRPVTQNGETASRSQSMTSSLTLQAFQKQQTSPNLPGTPFNASQVQTPKSTIRIVDKPKGSPKITQRAVDEDEDDGWAEMKRKREDKKKSKWSLKGHKKNDASVDGQTATSPTISDLYQGLET